MSDCRLTEQHARCRVLYLVLVFRGYGSSTCDIHAVLAQMHFRQLDRLLHSMAWYGMVWYSMVWYGMVWYGMVWYSMVWYGMVCEF